MYEIKTSNYVKSKKILVDGNTWTMTVPGAGDELALSQAQRRMKMLQSKLESGTATESDYDLMDKLESRTYDMFVKIFKDETKDNSQVKEWVNATPLEVIGAIFQDIKKQAEENKDDTVS